MTDLHLDQADSRATKKLLHQLESTEYEIALITGDIASARHLPDCLEMVAGACGGRPLYVVLGNHDYYGSCISATTDMMRRISSNIPNLHHLSSLGPVDLGDHGILVGCDGWADGQWRGKKSENIHSPDHYSLSDFKNMSYWGRIRMMRSLGQEAATSLSKRLRPSLRRHRKIIIASHVPPFRTAALFNGKPCDANHQPHFVHSKLGAMLIKIAGHCPSKEFTILGGHTHSECTDLVLPNIRCSIGGHQKNHPRIQQVIAA